MKILFVYVIIGSLGLIALGRGEETTETKPSSEPQPVIPVAPEQLEGRGNSGGSRTGKSISFFPEASSSAAGGSTRQDTVARRIRFGDNEDTNYVSNNDIGFTGSPATAAEIGGRRPVSLYKRPDDGSVFQSNPNYFANPYKYSYTDQGQYYNPQPDPSYYSQPQGQGDYFQPSPQSPPQYPQQYQNSPRPPTPPSPVTSHRPLSQTYHHIPYPQSQAYAPQPTPLYQQPYPHPGQSPSQGPYYAPTGHPQRPPPQYSPNYPYRGESGAGGGVGGLLGGLGSLFNGGGGGGPQNGIGAVGNQFGYAIENIVRFDDYQCVPKIVCQMVGNPQRQATLPGWLNAPILTA